MNSDGQLKRPLLYCLIVSVVIGALLGIGVILLNTWGWFEVRVILTTVIVAAASLCGLACELSKTPIGANWLPKSGLVVTGIAASLVMIGVWLDAGDEIFWKTAASLSIVAVAIVHVCLLSIAKLNNKFRWVFYIASQLVYGLAALLITIMIAELDSSALWRFVAALSIVVAALTLVIPILHRISRLGGKSSELAMPMEQRNLASIDEEIERLQEKIERLKRLRMTIVGK